MKNASLTAYMQIISKVDTSNGAPTGRPNVGFRFADQAKVYRRHVPLNKQGYDRGGAYWGIGKALYVYYTADLSFVEFKRQ